MVNITVRNIPNDIINKIKILSKLEKRSINNEILIILEKGLSNISTMKPQNKINKTTQLDIWNDLCGEWKDKRKTEEIINDIISNRSIGRSVDL